MIINPKPLFKTTEISIDDPSQSLITDSFRLDKEWKYFGKGREAAELDISDQEIILVCGCLREGIIGSRSDGYLVEIKRFKDRVVCKPFVFNFRKGKGKGRDIIIWLGKCPYCESIYWTCNSFDWIEWINDQAMINQFVDELGILNQQYQSATVLVTNSNIYRFNGKGELRGNH